MLSALRFRAILVFLFSVAAFLATPRPSDGQGFGLYEQGACAMGRAGAGVAAPCDMDRRCSSIRRAARHQHRDHGGVTATAARQFTNDTTGM